jgi:hypothetical protein
MVKFRAVLSFYFVQNETERIPGIQQLKGDISAACVCTKSHGSSDLLGDPHEASNVLQTPTQDTPQRLRPSGRLGRTPKLAWSREVGESRGSTAHCSICFSEVCPCCTGSEVCRPVQIPVKLWHAGPHFERYPDASFSVGRVDRCSHHGQGYCLAGESLLPWRPQATLRKSVPA